jgi:hypothetical protein
MHAREHAPGDLGRDAERSERRGHLPGVEVAQV